MMFQNPLGALFMSEFIWWFVGIVELLLIMLPIYFFLCYLGKALRII
jgi:hypothetical protein